MPRISINTYDRCIYIYIHKHCCLEGNWSFWLTLVRSWKNILGLEGKSFFGGQTGRSSTWEVSAFLDSEGSDERKCSVPILHSDQIRMIWRSVEIRRCRYKFWLLCSYNLKCLFFDKTGLYCANLMPLLFSWHIKNRRFYWWTCLLGDENCILMTEVLHQLI